MSSSVSLQSLPLAKAGQRFVLHGLTGSADALAIARYIEQHGNSIATLAVICAQPSDAQRLREEIAAFLPNTSIHVLPDWETLPYDAFSPHQDLISERLATLHQLQHGDCKILLVPASTALYRLAPPEFLAAYTFFFRKGEKLDEAKLKSQLSLAGYTHVTQVMSPGEYSVRGGLIDLFPMGSALPYRLDLFGDEIETIRTFDVDTQRSLYPVGEVRLLPGREFPMDENSRTAFRGRYREKMEGDPTRSTIYKDMGNGVPSAGIEYYLPLFFDELSTIFHYLPETAGKTSQLAFVGDCEAVMKRFWVDTQERYRFLSHDISRPVLPPEALFLTTEDLFTFAKPYARLALSDDHNEASLTQPLPDLAIERRAEDPLASLRHFVAHTQSRVMIAAESAGRRETLLQLFESGGLKPAICDTIQDFLAADAPFMLGIAPITGGFAIADEQLALITESELYAQSMRRRSGKRRIAKDRETSSVDAMVKDLAELRIGDPVVHSQHGIGRYLGLVSVDLGEGETEFLHLEYANQSQLYVPVSQLHVISRYSGAAPEDAPLHTLGSGQWEKARRKAAEQVRDAAAELLNLYARRAARQGHAFDYTEADYIRFAEGFGFEETPDQTAAINAVIGDMTSGKPMDRLVCGDVGFGKTEVALRAAFIAVMGGKQVAILAPTTLLAEQHFQTFSDRFSEWPVRLAELSRFRSTKEINAAIKEINAGTVDIVIGTHKLLSPEVNFKRLGLVIIDEEHRFGVRQKELLKSLRAEVDILTLTATPIPRTLGLALEGLREFSVIATAPQKRLAIKTFVRAETKDTIREAILRELKRGGQVYFLHNEVETIENRRAMLEELIPEARIAVAHGQMPERDLERIMHEFVTQRFNILLCTTIIETGIDVPTANTIIMHRADKFGLGQLHQLRGRVGRSHHQAYAYLLVHDVKGLTKQALKRLDAIQSMEELGSGFYLAMHDLEIRGAGEVLGENQSGNMQEIGFQLYSELLTEAVKALKAGKEPDLLNPMAATTEINLHVPALMPNDYCGDVHERLSIYKRLANGDSDEAIDDIQEEMIDRFGKMPEQVLALLETHRLRLQAKRLGVNKIDAHEDSIAIQFIPNPPIDAIKIIELIQKNKHIKLAGQDKLKIEAKSPDLKIRVQTVKLILKALQ